MSDPAARIIVEDTANRFYAVRDAGPGLDHLFLGIPVKSTKAGFVPRAKATEHLVRRVGCRVVLAADAGA